MRYHINPESGEPGECGALLKCPFASSEEHYDSPGEARTAYEAKMGSGIVVTTTEDLIPMGDPDPELLEDVLSSSRLRFKGVELVRNLDYYDRTEYEATTSSGATMTISRFGDAAVITMRAPGEDKVQLEVPMEGYEWAEKAEDARRIARGLELAYEKAKKELPLHFDEEHPAFKFRERMAEEMDSGKVRFQGLELRDTYGVAPRIWETEPDMIPEALKECGVTEVYVRQRHDGASLRIATEHGETINVYSDLVDDMEFEMDFPIFLTKAQDHLMGSLNSHFSYQG